MDNKRKMIILTGTSISVFLGLALFLYFHFKKTNTSTMNLSDTGLRMLKKLEGLRLTAYKDSAGVWTIGYGHTGNVRSGQTITSEEAETLLLSDVSIHENAVKSLGVSLSQNKFDALCCFSFNVGKSAFLKSTLAKKVKANPNDTTIISEFARWKIAGGVVNNGLVARRKTEAEMYNTGELEFFA
jgi:lysozyme